MNDRRQSAMRSPKPYGQKKYFKKGKRKPFGKDNLGSGESKYQKKDSRYAKGESKYKPRDNRFSPKNRFNKKAKGKPPWKKDAAPRIVSDMQITDGKHRGKYLLSTGSPKARPTVRRIREIMFRILFRKVRAGRFLDLCAGIGTVGIEAISRGSLLTTFVERSGKMCSLIKKNLEQLEINEGHGEICETEVVPFLKKMAKKRRFWDVVYYNPPFDTNYDDALRFFEDGVTIRPRGALVIEHHSEMFFPERIGVLKRFKVIVRGETAISFYERKA